MKLFLISLAVSFLFAISTASAITVNMSCGDNVCGSRLELFKDDWLELITEGQIYYIKLYTIGSPTDATLISNQTLIRVIEGQTKVINDTEYYIEYIHPESDSEEARVEVVITDEFPSCNKDCSGKYIVVACGDGVCNRRIDINESDTIQVVEDGRHTLKVERITEDSVEFRIDGRTRIVNEGELIGIRSLDLRVLRIDNEDKYVNVFFGDESVDACAVDCIEAECTEDDGGKNFYEKGVTLANKHLGVENQTYYHTELETFEDTCLTGPAGRVGYYVKEWWCGDNETAESTVFVCPNGCSDEACLINETLYCGDGICVEGEICPEDCNISNITGCKDHGKIPEYTEGDDMSLQCCEGLKHAIQKYTYDESCIYDFDTYGNDYVGICIACGDGACDTAYESVCNCPEDCTIEDTEPVNITSGIDVSGVTNQLILEVITNLEAIKNNLPEYENQQLTAVEINILETARAIDAYQEEIDSRDFWYHIMWFFGQNREQELADIALLRNQATKFSEYISTLTDISNQLDTNLQTAMQTETDKLETQIRELLSAAEEKEVSPGGLFG